MTLGIIRYYAIAFYAKHGYTKVGITFFELGNENHENLVLVGPDANPSFLRTAFGSR